MTNSYRWNKESAREAGRRSGLVRGGKIIPTDQYCENCTSVFRSKNSSQRFCSETCETVWKYNNISLPRFFAGEIRDGKTLRRILLKQFENRCEMCKYTTWLGQPIPLEVDHIDGNSGHNFPENLRLLCPNCHSQTKTYKNKNKGNGRAFRRKRYAEGKSY